MAALNLLPTELTPKASIIKFAAVLKKVATALSVILVFFLLGVVTLFILDSLKLKELNAQKEGLKASVQALETTEKQLVLVRDRISKVKKVWAQDSAFNNSDAVSSIITQNSGIVSFTSIDVSSKKVSLQVASPTSSGVAKFLSSFATTQLFKSVILKSLNFSPVTGYSLELEAAQ